MTQLSRITDFNLAGGMLADVVPVDTPSGYVVDALNILFDERGVPRKRGATANLATGAQTSFGSVLGAYRSTGPASSVIYANDTVQGLSVVDGSTAARTAVTGALGLPGAAMGRPFQHSGFLICPSQDNSGVATVMAAGNSALGTTTTTASSALTFTAGSNVVTSAGALFAASMVHGILYSQTAAGPTQIYVGKITAFTSSTSITVQPTPAVSFTGVATANSGIAAAYTPNLLSVITYSAGCGCSWQGRIVYGNVLTYGSGATNTQIWGTRIYWTINTVESSLYTGRAGVQWLGASFLSGDGLPQNNFFDLGSQDAVTALVPVSNRQMLAFTRNQTFSVTGALTTSTSSTSQITYDINQFPNVGGALQEAGVQRTTRGVVFADERAVWAFDGNGVVQLTRGKMQAYWRSLFSTGASSIVGSWTLGDWYHVSVNNGSGVITSLVVNLNTLAWSRWTGVEMFDAVSHPDPTKPGIKLGLSYAATVGTTSFANKQLVRIDNTIRPSATSLTTTDAQGGTIPFSITSKAYGAVPGGAKRKQWKRIAVIADVTDTTALTIPVKTTTDLDEVDTVLGSGIYTTQATLSPTNAQTVSTVTGGVPVQLTTASAHGLQSGDQVVVTSAASNSVNGMWVIEVVSSTVVKLPGSNAPTASGTAVIQRRPRKVVDLSAEEAPTLGIFIDATSSPPSDFTLDGFELEYMETPL